MYPAVNSVVIKDSVCKLACNCKHEQNECEQGDCDCFFCFEYCFMFLYLRLHLEPPPIMYKFLLLFLTSFYKFLFHILMHLFNASPDASHEMYSFYYRNFTAKTQYLFIPFCSNLSSSSAKLRPYRGGSISKADTLTLRGNLCPCEIFGWRRNAHGQIIS